MFELNLQHKFSATHKLENYIGDCSRIHGHEWRVNINIKTEELVKDMVIDFKEIKKAIDSKFDHQFINDMVNYNPTAENIAKDIYSLISNLMMNVRQQESPDDQIFITVWESDDASITYTYDNSQDDK